MGRAASVAPLVVLPALLLCVPAAVRHSSIVGMAGPSLQRQGGVPGAGWLPSGARTAVRTLPPHLVPCYSDPDLARRGARLPHTMANLIDLVQRVERDPSFVADLRLTVTSLLHRFRVDGLERNPLVLAAPGVTPYALTGLQHARHSVLAERLLPGNPLLLANSSLSLQQQCALHFMLSSAVDPWERGDEHVLCPGMPTPRSNLPAERRGGRGAHGGGYLNAADVEDEAVYWPGHRLYPDPVRDVGPWGGVAFVSPPPPFDQAPSAWSACPVEEGVVVAGPAGLWGGDVAPGPVLAGLAAGLQPQEVPLASLLSVRHLERLRVDGGRATDTVDNLWAATLAGDLAEVAVYQGPATKGVLALGPAGLWNDSVVPRVRYLSRERPGSPEHAPVRFWDMTDAEIRGGFDGLVLGSRAPRWTEMVSRLRLSQVLDMYYSPRGSSFQTDVRSCNRRAASASVFSPDTLFKQTARFARTLTDASPDAPYITEAVLSNFTSASTRAFLRYAGDLLNGDPCDSTVPLTSVRVNALVVLDTTWEREPAFKFTMTLAGGDGIDVGLFGSRMAVMNGGVSAGTVGGKWLVNLTDSPVQLVADWTRSDAEDDYCEEPCHPTARSLVACFKKGGG